jgi:NADH dehydrogenase FAD-containing subunit
MKKTKIVIAGGGFAGLYAAKYLDKHLARRTDVEVSLISRENFILFTPMLHEVAAGDLYPGDIVNPLRRILRHVQFVEADVQAIDLNNRRVCCIGGAADRELEFEFDYLPTAQHGLREGLLVAKNIEAAIAGRPPRPFVFTMLGQLATIGRRTGVAMVFGVKFSDFIAWWFWRSVYLMKLPRLAKKLRVMMSWTLDLFFGREIEQMITLRDVEALTNVVSRVRSRARQSTPASARSALETSGNNQR